MKTAAECFEDNAAKWTWTIGPEPSVPTVSADPRKPLSLRQREVLEIIRKNEKVSYGEIAQGLGILPRAVHIHINALISKGYISKQFGVTRSFRLIPQPEASDAEA